MSKNIVLVTYSTTGNTKIVQGRIIKQLKEASFSVASFDALSIIKAYQLGRKKSESLSVEAVNGTLIPDLRQAISNADVVGVGGFAFCLQTPPGLSEIFNENYLPSDLFKNMKYFFSFGTAGQKIGTVHDIIATSLSTKNDKSIYIGGLTVICPENFAPLQPPKGKRDMWGQEQLDKISPFVSSLISVFNGTTPAKSAPFKKAYFENGLMQAFCKFTCGKVLVDKQKCIKCGTCVRNCPYGGLSMSADIEDGFPHWNASKCEICHMCYNHCPKEAIDLGNAKTKNKARYPSPFLDPQTEAILSTDPATHTVVGIPLPTSKTLAMRNLRDYAPILAVILIILLVIVLFIVL